MTPWSTEVSFRLFAVESIADRGFGGLGSARSGPLNLMSSIDKTVVPLVSVIVPCYNSERTIWRCLTSIINQQTSISYDVTVVDSSSDQTPRIVEREFPSVRLIHLEKRAFAGAARNVGIRATKAPYCLMIDSDCVARPKVIELMMARHRAGRHAAVGGSAANGRREA